jgi:hypothetical protein
MFELGGKRCKDRKGGYFIFPQVLAFILVYYYPFCNCMRVQRTSRLYSDGVYSNFYRTSKLSSRFEKEEENMNKFFYLNQGTREYVLRLDPIRYVVMRVCLRDWAIPLKIQWFKWYLKRDVEWYIDFLCFHFTYNNYGVLIRDGNWPMSWQP